MRNRNASPSRAGAPSWLTYFVRMPYQIIASDAYLTLPPKTQVVLLDFIRHHDRYTQFGQFPPPPGGVPYSYGHCAIVMHRNTYAIAIDRLEERGFLLATGQMDIDGETTYFQTSGAWRRWAPSEKDQLKLAKLRKRIQRREHHDARITCTLKVHPPAEKIDNALLKFWAKTPPRVPEKSAGLPFRSDRDIQEPAHAHGTQEQCQFDAEEAVQILAEWKAKRLQNRGAIEADARTTDQEPSA